VQTDTVAMAPFDWASLIYMANQRPRAAWLSRYLADHQAPRSGKIADDDEFD
jgi:hypothetical protein